MEHNRSGQRTREVFRVQMKTKDGFDVVVGGICPTGQGKEAVRAYTELKRLPFGDTRDIYLVDFNLADVITKLSPVWVEAVGAAVAIPDITGSTGGILGNPFASKESANGVLEEIGPDLWLITFPGGPGVAFQGSYENGVKLQQLVLAQAPDIEGTVDSLLRFMPKISDIFVIVTDGSGAKTQGNVYISG